MYIYYIICMYLHIITYTVDFPLTKRHQQIEEGEIAEDSGRSRPGCCAVGNSLGRWPGTPWSVPCLPCGFQLDEIWNLHKLTKLIETCRKFWVEVIGIRWIDWILLDCGNSFWHPLVPVIVAGWTQLIFFGSFLSSNTNKNRETRIYELPPFTCIHHLNLFTCGMLHGVTGFAINLPPEIKPHITGAEVNPPLAAYTQQLHLHPSRGKNLRVFGACFVERSEVLSFSHFLLSFFFPNEWFSN